ncbi:MAG TPA: phosphoribosyltransferase family protein [Chitinophagaceae bacterium]|nr:phosphoribosyltransferase family protein [Chitinophagaceae bacterium]
MNKIPVLDLQGIQFRIKRMAYEIWEKYSHISHIYLVGIEDTGLVLAQRLQIALNEISPLKVELIPLKLNKKNPLLDETIILPYDLTNANVVLVDDVANSGKTLAFAMKHLLTVVPERLTIAVLVDRKHKDYPIRPDIIGLSLSTTIQEHITVVEKDGKIEEVYLN